MRQVKVWDLFVRFSHWGLGLLVLGSFLTSENDRLTPIHVRIGLGVLAIVLARVARGLLRRGAGPVEVDGSGATSLRRSWWAKARVR